MFINKAKQYKYYYKYKYSINIIFFYLSSTKVYIFLVDICFATIAGCSGLESSYILQHKKTIDHHSLLKSLSQAVRSLSFQIQWNTVLDKVIYFLIVTIYQ